MRANDSAHGRRLGDFGLFGGLPGLASPIVDTRASVSLWSCDGEEEGQSGARPEKADNAVRCFHGSIDSVRLLDVSFCSTHSYTPARCVPPCALLGNDSAKFALSRAAPTNLRRHPIPFLRCSLAHRTESNFRSRHSPIRRASHAANIRAAFFAETARAHRRPCVEGVIVDSDGETCFRNRAGWEEPWNLKRSESKNQRR